MEKILLVPDSFKGTLSSRQVCQVMAGQLRRFFPQAQVKSIPVADGGEGSVEAFLAAAGGERRTRTVTGPFGEPVEAFYGILGDGRTAVIEMAACAGLPLAEGRLNPERATTYGVGELLLAAKEAGCTKAILGLGGSCTNDGGRRRRGGFGGEVHPGRRHRLCPHRRHLGGDCRFGCLPGGPGAPGDGAHRHVRH